MKLNKSDRSFLEACQNPARRTALIGNLVTQRKWFYILSGLMLVLCVADPFIQMVDGKGAPPSPVVLLEFTLCVALALNADAKIKTLLSMK
ncbi:MAG: hypothetical protein WC661_20890 [Opitutaceae bacterium]|jgi:hypothetical protein